MCWNLSKRKGAKAGLRNGHAKSNALQSSASNGPSSETTTGSFDLSFLTGGGEMGERIRGFNWGSTPLGPLETWPGSLRNAVSILLRSPFPMTIIWGRSFIFLYNDALIPIAGDKHPKALGKPAFENYPEIWPIVGPMLENVLITGKANSSEDSLLVMDRKGYLEETYETFSYIPILLESGVVGGSFEVSIPTTDRVIGERRLRTLRDLALIGAQTTSLDEVCRRACEVLGKNPSDIPFALVYSLDDARTRATLVAFAGIEPGLSASPVSVDLKRDADGLAHWPLASAAAGSTVLINDLEAKFRNLPGGAWPASPQSALIFPLVPSGHPLPTRILVVAVSPRKALDTQYRTFFDLIASQISGIFADVLAHELEHRRAETLAALDRAKTAFFSNVSHEFRTPLTLILCALEDVLSRSSSSLCEVDCERVHLALRNGMRLQKLVNRLLDFSRIEANRMEADFELADLSGLTSEIASVFRSVIEDAGLGFSVHCPPLPGPAYVDGEMWEKVVLNLLSNAFKYTLDGEIEVLLGQFGQTIELSVRDTGVGIPESELPHIFERFHRVAGVQGRAIEGTGIGLALVHELVKMHGGSIRVESTYHKGSTFTVAIPVGREHLPGNRVRASRPPGMVANPQAYLEEALSWVRKPNPAKPPVTVSARRVLVVDDNADMRDYIASLLSADYEVVTVADGREAFVEALRSPPALVVADVMMPHLGGFELLAALRAEAKTQAIPVLLLSARAGEEDKIEGLAKGAEDYLTKPFSARELRARVASQIELAQFRHELRHRTETALMASILESLRNKVAVIDGEGIIIGLNRYWLNPGARNDAPLQSAVEVGVNYLDVCRKASATQEDLRESLTGILSVLNGSQDLFELEYTRPHTHQQQWFRMTVTELAGSQGGAVISHLDITQQKLAELDRQRTREELARMNRAIEMGKMVASLTHELAQPLAAILSNAQAASRLAACPNPDLAEIQSALADIASADRRARAVMDNVRAMLKERTLAPHRVNLNAIVEDVARLVRGTAHLRGVHLRPILWPYAVLVEGDEIPLQQVLLNLVNNAMDAMNQLPAEQKVLTMKTTIQGSSALSVQGRQSEMTQNNLGSYCFKLVLQWRLPRAIRTRSCPLRI